MAELEGGGGGGKHKGGKKRGKKLSTRVDFTPMVDLGFLLITFFMLTTSMNKPQTMEISMPDKEPTTEPTVVPESQTLTLLLTKEDKIVYYFMKDKEPDHPMITNYSAGGVRSILLKENKLRNPIVDSIAIYKKQLDEGAIIEDIYRKQANRIKGYKDALIVIIKATDQANFKNLVDILDEMLICNIGRYAIVDISDGDKEILKTVNLE